MTGAALLWRRRGKKGLAVTPAHATELTAQLDRLTDLERQVLQRKLGRTPTAHDRNKHFDDQLTFGQRLADRVAVFGGSWTFIGVFGARAAGDAATDRTPVGGPENQGRK